jgi:hypothetical protein
MLKLLILKMAIAAQTDNSKRTSAQEAAKR